MPKVVVIGGGIVGLTTGIALKKAGFDVLVCERHPEIRGVGAALGLWPNALRIFDRLNVLNDIEANSDPTGFSLFRDPSGAVLARERFSKVISNSGYSWLLIHRAKLNVLLAEALGYEHIKLNARFTSYASEKDRVTAFFADGSFEEADLLVGADGMYSSVRGQLAPNIQVEPELGQVAWRGLLPERGEGFVEHLVFGRERTRAGCLRAGNGLIFWVLAQFHAGSQDPAGPKAEGLARIPHVDDGGWGFPLRELVEATPEDAVLRDVITVVPELSRWTDGRVLLIGDAAHGMSPHAAVGATLGIEDVQFLADCLTTTHDFATALRRYEENRQSFYRKVTVLTRKIAETTAPADYANQLVDLIEWML